MLKDECLQSKICPLVQGNCLEDLCTLMSYNKDEKICALIKIQTNLEKVIGAFERVNENLEDIYSKLPKDY